LRRGSRLCASSRRDWRRIIPRGKSLAGAKYLGQLAARLRALGSQGTLDRGYALVLDAQGHPLVQAKKTLEGSRCGSS